MLVSLIDDKENNSAKSIMRMGIKAQALSTPGMNLPTAIPFRITVTDWQIIRLLLRDAEKEVRDLSEKVKLSRRTVNRRLNEMMNARAIFVMPCVNLKNAGGVPYHLMIQSEEERKSKVDELVASRIGNLVFRASVAETGSIFGFTGANVADGNEVLKWVKKLPGVRTARLSIVEEVVHVFDWLDKEVAGRTTI